MFRKQDYFDENDQPNRDLLFYSSHGPIGRENLEIVIDQCLKFTTIDPCQKAYDVSFLNSATL